MSGLRRAEATSGPRGPGRRRAARAAAVRVALLTLAWWALAEGDGRGPGLAAATIALAVATSLVLLRPGTVAVRPAAIPGFVAFFLWQSVRGAVDVARRTVQPHVPLDPLLKHRRLRLPSEPARVFLAACLSLFAGTFSARLSGRELTVHVLDDRIDAAGTIDELERRVARLFGLELEPGDVSLTPDDELGGTRTRARRRTTRDG